MAYKQKGFPMHTTSSALKQDIKTTLTKEGMVKGSDDVWRDPLDIYKDLHGDKTRKDFDTQAAWDAHKIKMTEYVQSKSALKQETKKETVKAGWKKEADNMKKEVEAGKSGDVLTENIRRTARKKSYEK